MSTTLLPPSGRDFEIFRYVRFDEKSTRDAAEWFGLSQTRICQIVRHIDDYLLDVSPAEKDDPRRNQRVHVAEQVAAERVGRLYGKALQAFEDSRGVQASIRSRFGESSVHSSKDTQGDPKYLWIACRVAMQGGKLPVSRLESYVCLDEEVAAASEAQNLTIVDVADDARQVVDLEETSPPVEDCSAAAKKEEVATNPETAGDAASPSPAEACVLPPFESMGPKFGAARTVQSTAPPVRGKTAKRRREFLNPTAAS